MTESEYLEQAEALLRAVEQRCDALSDADEVDVDARRVGNTLTLEFGAGRQVVVSLQKPLKEVWLASQSGGYHFRCDGAQWLNTREAGPGFYTQLSHDVSRLCEAVVTFEAPPTHLDAG